MSVSNDTSATVPSPGPVFTSDDLLSIVRIIDYACEQGAFRDWGTIEGVARLRARALTFLQANAPHLFAQPQAAPASAPEQGV